MNKENLVKDVLSLIYNQNIENEIREALSSKQEKHTEQPLKQKEKSSNHCEVYYDQATGEAVGIVYKNIVFLKHISKAPMSWNKAVAYCATIVINGIKARLSPVDEHWQAEFEKISRELYFSLKEIGAEHLDGWIWADEYSQSDAWYQRISDGSFVWHRKSYSNRYVRPVLVLK